MAKKEDACTIEVRGEFSVHALASLQLLYYPLIKENAIMLYNILLSLGSREHKVSNHILMCTLTQQSMEGVLRSRHILEQYLLLKSFYNSKDNIYIYQVYMPMEGSKFLRHEVFGRLFLQTMGTKVYEFSKISFAHNEHDKEGFSEITIPFENVIKDTWKVANEAQFIKIKPEDDPHMHNDMPLTFNFNIFLKGLSYTILPLRERSKENLQTIGELATIHGISEKEMVTLVSRSCLDRNHKLNIGLLRQKVLKANTIKDNIVNTNPYEVSPIYFLQQKQHGIGVSEIDKILIETLISKYKLSIEVCNFLIEYCLNRNNQELGKNFVEKIAATWARLQIDTLEKAMEYTKAEHVYVPKTLQSANKALPEWYNNQEEISDDPEEKAKLLAEIEKLRGN